MVEQIPGLPGVTITRAADFVTGTPIVGKNGRPEHRPYDVTNPPATPQATSLGRKCCTEPAAPEPPPGEILGGFWHKSQPRTEGWLANALNEPAESMFARYRGASVFLCGGGPSIKKQDLSILERRGIVIAAMNNIGCNPAVRIRPDLWFSVDANTNFHPSIFADASITKFVRHSWRRVPTRKAEADPADELLRGGPQARKHANILFYNYKFGSFSGDNFLSRPRPPWGYEWSRIKGDRTQTRSVMFSTFYILYWLGFRTIFLLGTDLSMNVGNEYAFNAGIRNKSHAAGNNMSFQGIRKFFARSKDHFYQNGLRVYNCSARSKLSVFPRIELKTAVEFAAKGSPEPTRVAGLYT